MEEESRTLPTPSDFPRERERDLAGFDFHMLGMYISISSVF